MKNLIIRNLRKMRELLRSNLFNIMLSKLILVAIIFFPLSFVSSAQAMPQMFLFSEPGNHRDVQWKRLESQNFVVYHDARSLPLAQHALHALETAYPDFSVLLGVKLKNDRLNVPHGQAFIKSRFEKIPLILSTQTDGTAFANLVSQNLEVPALSGTSASLFQHELTHRMMYEHFDPKVGAAGRAFSLAMVPTWWIEGLPEYFTESMGRLESAGILRTMALENSFLSFNRLHALYKASGDVFLRGYATSGRFLKFIFGKLGNPDLYKVHQDFSSQVLIPPFMNAIEQYLHKNLKQSPEELYQEFVSSEIANWKQKLANMPKLVLPNSQQWVTSSGLPSVFALNHRVVISQLTVPPYPSALIINNNSSVILAEQETTSEVEKAEKTQKLVSAQSQQGSEQIEQTEAQSKRISLNVRGGGRWSLHPSDAAGGGFWTAENTLFDNGTRGHIVKYVKFSGEISEITDDKIKVTNEFKIATPENPNLLKSLLSIGNQRAFALTALRGSYTLWLFDAKLQKTRKLRTWNSPDMAKLVADASANPAQKACVAVIIDSDLEKTRIEEICEGAPPRLLLPSRKLVVRDAIRNGDNSLTLLIGWGDVLGLATLQSKGSITPIAAFPEWVESIQPWHGSADVGAWVFNGYDYALRRINLQQAKQNYEQWVKTLSPANKWSAIPAYVDYEPPFKVLARTKRMAMSTNTQTQASALESGDAMGEVGEVRTTPPADLPGNEKKETAHATSHTKPRSEEATYRHRHWFTYPLIVPPPLDTWSLGLISVPWVEEMERQRIVLYGTYNFYTKNLSGTASYSNKRIFDDLQVDVFIRERFNGLYYLTDCNQDTCRVSRREASSSYKRFSTLREKGIGLNTFHLFLPSSVKLNLRSSFFSTTPLYGSLSGVLGPQYANVIQLGSEIQVTQMERAFYTGGQNTDGSWAHFTSSSSFSADKYVGIGNTHTGNRNPTAALNYQKFAASLTNSIQHKSHKVSWRVMGSATRGPQTFLAEEIFQPYRTYLLGSGAGMNNINVPLSGDLTLFSRTQGRTLYRTTLDYSFPLLEDLDKRFYIFYVENLRGEVVLGRGGVAEGNSIDKFQSVSSASAAGRMLIDVKGVQVFPSIAYGKVLGGPGWALFTEIAFAQLF